MIKIVLLVALALVAISEAAPAYGDAYGDAPSLNEYAVNAVNGRRQEYVNARAVYHGTGIGVADVVGVPGTAHSNYNGYYGGHYNGHHANFAHGYHF